MSCFDSPSAREHRAAAPDAVACAVLTVSDTRTLADDRSGSLVVELLEAAGHRLAERLIVRDEPADVADVVRRFVAAGADAVLITGGTGISARDQTPDALAGMFTRELPGYGELFRMLSYQEIGAAAMLSRAVGGVIGQTIVLLMPGSTAAVRLAMEKLILPEIGHLVAHARK
jgi:molybdenum cofactor biosynthesis protein B